MVAYASAVVRSIWQPSRFFSHEMHPRSICKKIECDRKNSSVLILYYHQGSNVHPVFYFSISNLNISQSSCQLVA